MPESKRSVPRLVLAAAAGLALSAVAEAGSPRVSAVYPSAGQVGSDVEISCKGSNLAEVRTLLFDDGGIEVSEIKSEKNKFTARVKIGKDVRIGEHSFRAVTTSGVADLRLFHVSPFPLVEEQEAKPGSTDAVQEVPLGTTVYGRTQNEDQDRFAVELKKGQRFTAVVVGARLQSQNIYDPHLSIEKADGTLVAEADDCTFGRQDPVATLLAPEDGRYVVTIREATNMGPGESHYLMHLGSFAQPQAVYPPGGQAGMETRLRLLAGDGADDDKTVELPGRAIERHPIFLEREQPSPLPSFVRVSSFPNVLESEPNDEHGTATDAAAALPIALNGVIEAKGDVDYFKIVAKKGQAYDLSVFARQLRSPLDSVLSVYDAKGKRLQQNDDDGQSDSHLRWNAPADGEFYLAVNDQLDRGGPFFTYRLEVTPVAPEITIGLPSMVQNSSQERRAIVVPKGNRYASLVRVRRADVAGDIELKPENLPPGVTFTGTRIDKSVDTVPMVFEAADDATVAAQHFEVAAELPEPPKDAPAVPSRVHNEIDVAENGNQRAFYAVVEDRLPVAVVEEVPVKLTLTGPKVPVLQNGPMTLKVKAERAGDFKGPITLSLLYVPPGIGSPGTVQIKEGESEGTVTISANDKAALQKWKVCVAGSADFGKGPVWVSTQLVDLEVAPPFVAGKIERGTVDQGDGATVTVKLEQKVPFEGKAKLALMGLPQGVTADDQEITKETTEVTFPIKAAANAQAGQHRQLFCQFTLTQHDEPMVSNFAQGGVLRVDKGTVASK